MTGTNKAKSHRSGNRERFRPAFLAVLAGFALLLSAPAMHAGEPATVAFSLDFPNSDPEHYSITVHSDGSALYACSARISPESEDRETYQSEFKVSEVTRARIFDLAKQANYFSGKIDSGKRKLAFTGAKKLSYKDGQPETSADYNYSALPAVQQLTVLFQSVGATLEFGRRLDHYHHFQKLALDDELKQMEDQVRRGDLIELQIVKPVLQEIHDDSSVINIVRVRARRIIEMGDAPPAH